MTDREKVISTMEEIKTQTAGIGLDSAVIAHKFIDKIIALLKEQQEEIENLKQTAQSMMEGAYLLKEQEAVEPEKEYSGSGITWWNVCGNCKTAINPNDKFCHECGRRVLWEGR